MTDQKIAHQNSSSDLADDDPLAELARIVSGEARPSPPAAEIAASIAPDLTNVDSEMNLEAELMRELGAESGADSQEREVEVTESAPAIQEEIEQKLETQLMEEFHESTADEPVDVIAPASGEAATGETNIDLERLDAQLRADLEMADQAAQEVLSKDFHQAATPGISDGEMNFEAAVEQTYAAETANPDGIDNAVEASTQAHQLREKLSHDADFGEAFTATVNEIADRQPISTAETSLSADLEADFSNAFADELGIDQPTQGQATEYADQATHDSESNPLGGDPGSLIANDIDTPQYSHAAAGGRSGGFKLALAALSIALIAGLGFVGWGSLSGNDGSSEPAVIIKADTEPVKVKPVDPGGKKIANTDNKVYESVSGQSKSEVVQENLISSRQKPVDIAKDSSRLEPGDDSIVSTGLNGVSPKRVQTLTIRQDGSIVRTPEPIDVAVAKVPNSADPISSTNAFENSGASGLKNGSTDGQSPVTEKNSMAITKITSKPSTASVPTETVSKPEILQPVSKPAVETVAKPTVETVAKPTVKTVAKPVTTPVKKPVAAPTVKPPTANKTVAARKVRKPTKVDANAPTQIATLPSKSTISTSTPAIDRSDWSVQVSSQRSEDAAKSSYGNLKRKFSSLLSDRQASVQKADVKGKGIFYRVRIPASSKSDAVSLCERLKSAGGSCFVTR